LKNFSHQNQAITNFSHLSEISFGCYPNCFSIIAQIFLGFCIESFSSLNDGGLISTINPIKKL
jgi:hypothetical protein